MKDAWLEGAVDGKAVRLLYNTFRKTYYATAGNRRTIAWHGAAIENSSSSTDTRAPVATITAAETDTTFKIGRSSYAAGGAMLDAELPWEVQVGFNAIGIRAMVTLPFSNRTYYMRPKTSTLLTSVATTTGGYKEVSMPRASSILTIMRPRLYGTTKGLLTQVGYVDMVIFPTLPADRRVALGFELMLSMMEDDPILAAVSPTTLRLQSFLYQLHIQDLYITEPGAE